MYDPFDTSTQQAISNHSRVKLYVNRFHESERMRSWDADH